MPAPTTPSPHPVDLAVDFPAGERNRLTALVRPLLAVPIILVAGLLVGAGSHGEEDSCRFLAYTTGGILILPVMLMILVRQKYPRWWFDWNLELTRFVTRVWAYFMLLRDEYPSTDARQAVQLDIVYPNAREDLNPWIAPLKWFMVLPHYFVLPVLWISGWLAAVLMWMSILFTGHGPRELFDFMVAIHRWGLRVFAYAFLLVTDEYPPFRLRD